MKHQFTAGDWSINDWAQPDGSIAIGAVGTPLIARIPMRDVSIREQQANARLITAAPRMLAALESIAAEGKDGLNCQCEALSWYGEGHTGDCPVGIAEYAIGEAVQS